MNEELDSILATIESWQDSREGIRQRAMEWVASPLFVSTFYDNAHVPKNARDRLREGIGAKEAENIWDAVKGFGIQNPDLFAKYRALAHSGQVVYAHGVITNPGFAKMPDKNLPCLFVVSEEQDSASVVTAGILASALSDLYLLGDGRQERPTTFKFVRDDDFHLLRRRPLPLDEVNGFEATLLDVLMRKSWMPPATLPFVPLLISPERGGAVVQIPWYVVMGEPASAEDLEPGVWHEIAEMDRVRPSRPTSSVGQEKRRSAAPASSRQPPKLPRPQKPPFSIRILLLRIIAILLVMGYLAKISFIFTMESRNFDSGFLGAYQQSLLADNKIESWDSLTPADLGRLVGSAFLPLVFSVLALVGAFRRIKTMSIVSNVLLIVSGLGRGYLPIGPIASFVLVLIPGRTDPWGKGIHRK